MTLSNNNLFWFCLAVTLAMISHRWLETSFSQCSYHSLADLMHFSLLFLFSFSFSVLFFFFICWPSARCRFQQNDHVYTKRAELDVIMEYFRKITSLTWEPEKPIPGSVRVRVWFHSKKQSVEFLGRVTWLWKRVKWFDRPVRRMSTPCLFLVGHRGGKQGSCSLCLSVTLTLSPLWCV